MVTPMDIQVGDVIELRKKHPCGGTVWRVLRVGLDIGVECTTCQRYVLVPRSRLENRIKRFVNRFSDDTNPEDTVPIEKESG
ncbi:MAG: DUF951 domain-containing protein [Anaerolineae bacterium]|nr:DUF951 domain-containing protein [Anaerolineae bacterium]